MVIKKTTEELYRTKVLDHLGLVAGMCKELKIAELIDRHLPNESAADKILNTIKMLKYSKVNRLTNLNKNMYVLLLELNYLVKIL